MQMKTGKVSLFAMTLIAGLGLAACEEQGPAEQLGESIDETVEEVGDGIKDATN
jgi:hypothetical protein